MKTKIGYISIGIIFTLILSFTWISFADQSSEVSGNLVKIDGEHQKITVVSNGEKRVFTLDKDTTIYRNAQKVGLSALKTSDKVKVLLNSEGQVRYVVAEYTTAQKEPDPSGKSEPEEQSVKTAPVPAASQPEASHILEFELQLKDKNEREYKLEYKNKHGKMKMKGKKAAYINQFALTPDMNKEEVIQRILSTLKVSEHSLEKLELKVLFANGKKIEVESENEHDDDDD